VAYLLGRNLTLGALAAALVVALGVGLFSRRGMIKEDTAIGVLFAAALSLGVVLISSIRTYAVDLSHILFGNVLGVSSLDLWLTAIIGVVILASILVFYRQFLVISFDPVLAATLRIRVGLFNNLLLVLLALTIVISMQTVGVGLVAAMLVTPAATAFLLVRRVMVGPEVEKTALVRHANRLFLVGANLDVTYMTVILRKAYGLGAIAMAGGSYKEPAFTVSCRLSTTCARIPKRRSMSPSSPRLAIQATSASLCVRTPPICCVG